MSPYTPGHVADVHNAEQLGEIGVGMHFSLKDLMSVRNIAIPVAVIQSLLATALTIVATMAFGWSLGAGIVLRLAFAVTSTVLRQPPGTARSIGAGLAQIGKFSFTRVWTKCWP